MIQYTKNKGGNIMDKQYYIIYTDGKGGKFAKAVFSKEELFENIIQLSRNYSILDVAESSLNFKDSAIY